MLNKAVLIGNIGREVETRVAQSGTSIASFSIATNEKWKDKSTGEYKTHTEWHNITAFGRLAEICSDYLGTGDLVYIEGKIETQSWEKDGVTRYTTKIIAREMKMLGSKARVDSPNGKEPSKSEPAPTPPPPQMPLVAEDIPF